MEEYTDFNESNDNVVYYRPVKSLFNRVLSGFARGFTVLTMPMRRNARWKKHNVYKLRPFGQAGVKKSSGRTWKRHRIPEMPRTRFYGM